MKKLLVLFVFILAVGSASAQQSFTVSRADSLVDADTISYVIDHKDLQKADYYYSFYFEADSISGATAGTFYVQVSNASSGDYWYPIDTITINGTNTLDWSTGTLQANRVRLYGLSTGTQRTWVYFHMHAVPRE